MLDFWERAALAYRGDGTRQAWDTGTSRIYDDDTDRRAARRARRRSPTTSTGPQVKRFNATLVNHLFLLYFDTRAGYGDTGPYAVPGPARADRSLVRDFYRLADGDFPWSTSPADVPYHHLTAALVLDDVQSTFTDFGTSNHTPEDYLDRLVGFGLYTTDGLPPGELRPVPAEEHDDIVAAVRKAQAQHYRNIAAMDRDEKIRAGAYVYFSFLRPFAEIAGVADELDWSVPRDLPEPLYELMSAMQGENAGVPEDEAYYELYPEDDAVSDRPPAVDAARRRRAGPPAGRGAALGRVLVLRLHRPRGHARRLRAPRPLPEPRRGLVLGLPRRRGPAARDRDRPRGGAARRPPSLEIRADGPVGRPRRRDAVRPHDPRLRGVRGRASTTRRRSTATSAATGCRSASTSSGRPTAAASTRGSARPATRCPCNVHGEILVGDETIDFDGIGQRDHSWGVRDWWSLGWVWTAGGLEDGTRFHTARIRVPGLEAFAPGLRAAARWRRRADRRVHGRGGARRARLPHHGARRVRPARHGHRAALLQPRAPGRRRRHGHPARPLPAGAVPLRDGRRPVRRRLDRVEPTGRLTTVTAIPVHLAATRVHLGG